MREVAGVPLLVHAVRGLCDSREIALVVVAAPPGESGAVEAMLRAGVRAGSHAGLGGGAGEAVRLHVVEGGDTRQQSVALALQALPADVDVVLVHDAARALTPPEVCTRVARAVRAGAPAVVPVQPLADTVKRVFDDRVDATLDRARLRAVQTPQGFDREVLVRAHGAAAAAATDDASLVEALGLPVTVVEGSQEAFKVTRPLDLLLAEALLRTRGDHSSR
jgi:2-C-methyl-D-erythritol 4-phosphate cytidylyltransferase